MQRKIRHALVQYVVKNDDGTPRSYEVAFRNQVVDIPDDQVERLDAEGATVAPDMDLERPGTMSALPETASDGEITNWVVGASNAEVELLVRERPVMASRILAAHASVAERFSEQNIHLGGLQEIADEAEASAQERADIALLSAVSEADMAVLSELKDLSQDDVLALAMAAEGDLIGDTTPAAFNADELVAGNAKSVTDFISENPRLAAVILEAEGRRAVAAKEEPRVTIVRAAEAAAGFTQ